MVTKYIDISKFRKEVKRRLDERVVTQEYYRGAMWVLNLLYKAERDDEETVAITRAEWILVENGFYECSSCKNWKATAPAYCPYCGAKMDLKK